MDRYLIKINDLNDKNRFIEENISTIKECVSNIINLKKNIRWTSPSKDKLIIKYDEYIETLNKMVDNLESCLKVTKKYYTNYSNGYQEIKNDFKKVSRDLGVRNEQKY